MQPYVSFCVPTNGIKEWVIPVLDSIYCTNADIEELTKVKGITESLAKKIKS